MIKTAIAVIVAIAVPNVSPLLLGDVRERMPEFIAFSTQNTERNTAAEYIMPRRLF